MGYLIRFGDTINSKYYISLSGGSLRPGNPFYDNLKTFFLHFFTSPMFSLVEANDEYEDSPEAFFLFFPRSSLGVLEPILSKNGITF